MARLTRAETQERNRARVLAAARDEFTERGFREARIDDIAERAELTRGAVYSNFPGKRGLYLAVLAEDAERGTPAPDAEQATPTPGTERATHDGTPPVPTPDTTPRAALEAFARAWVARLPLATEEPRSAARLGRDLVPEILADERIRQPFAQLMKLNAVLLGLALEQLGAAGRRGTPRAPRGAPAAGSDRRQVRIAETVLTTLYGASQLAAAAPGFVEPFTVTGACAQLADLDLDDRWEPPHLPYVPPARPVDEPWSPPAAVDTLRGTAARLDGDGVLAILGLHRVAAVEEAVRAAPPDVDVTVVLVTQAPTELTPLARLTVAELRTCLQRAFPASAWPRLQVVQDPAGSVAAAAGVPVVSDATESAVRIRAGRIVARADGYGACHAAASAAPPAADS
ncbi:helix-turn-helix domain-containing protein [Plantactinospora sp. B24E8]|uniref:TetR/AcrR family transcriptional regulator n=1 Tax=Plantactinospora sp. B24E8 TaxID=3153567 RepID=UPI00325DB1C2